jgi:hypothetical protein
VRLADEKPTQPAPAAKWPTKRMGKSKIDLDDKEAVRAVCARCRALKGSRVLFLAAASGDRSVNTG